MPEPPPGPSLSDKGREEAEQAANHIAALRASLPRLAAVYTSPLQRARETAGAVAKALDLEPAEVAGLKDCDAGEWAGAPLKQLARKPEWATVVHYPSGFRFPGGESLSDMQARVVGTVKALAGAHNGEALVVVSHADPIKGVLADALGLHLDLFQRLVVAPASVSAVAYSAGGPTVMLTNWTAPSRHVPGSAPEGAGTAKRRRP